eukprot:gene20264-22654_t
MFVVLTVFAISRVSARTRETNCDASQLHFDWSIPKVCRSVDTSSYSGGSNAQSELAKAIDNLRLAGTFTLEKLKVSGNSQMNLMRAVMEYRKAGGNLQYADGSTTEKLRADFEALEKRHEQAAAIREKQDIAIAASRKAFYQAAGHQLCTCVHGCDSAQFDLLVVKLQGNKPAVASFPDLGVQGAAFQLHKNGVWPGEKLLPGTGTIHAAAWLEVMFDVAGARDASDLRLLEPWMLTRNVRRAYVDQRPPDVDFTHPFSRIFPTTTPQPTDGSIKGPLEVHWQMALHRFDSPLRIARITHCLATSNTNHGGGEL